VQTLKRTDHVHFTQVDQLVLSESVDVLNRTRGQTDRWDVAAHLAAFPLHVLEEVAGLNVGPSTYPEGSHLFPHFLLPPSFLFTVICSYIIHAVQTSLLNKS
jgi:hypothetical protein